LLRATGQQDERESGEQEGREAHQVASGGGVNESRLMTSEASGTLLQRAGRDTGPAVRRARFDMSGTIETAITTAASSAAKLTIPAGPASPTPPNV
jgi:hypothetical protein